MGKLNAATDSNFESEVLQSEQPVLVDFWAVWCGPCRMIAPIVEQIANEYQGQLKVMKLDVDDNQATAMTYRVMGIPTLILFKDGRESERITGYMPKERLLSRLRRHLETVAS